MDSRPGESLYQHAGTKPFTPEYRYLCRGLPTGGKGKAVISQLSVGSQLCLNTNDGRWALITIRELPASRLSVLRLHVALSAV